MSFATQAMLVSFNTTQWSARKLDKKVSVETCTANHATPDSGNFNKQLVPKTFLAKINKVVSAASTYHYANTLAWEHKGATILPAKNYLTYVRRMGEYHDQFDHYVDEFVQEYPNILLNLINNLQDLYNANDYPDAHKIKSKFTMSFNVSPVPTADDFRVEIGDKEMMAIKQKLVASEEQAAKAAEKDLFMRFYTAVATASMTLSVSDKVFRNSLILNVLDICNKIPNMNVLENVTLENKAAEVLLYTNKLDLKHLRDDGVLRDAASKSFKTYAESIEEIYNASL